MKNRFGLFVFFIVLLLFVSGCFPLANIYNSLWNVVNNEGDNYSQDTQVATTALIATISPNSYPEPSIAQKNGGNPTPITQTAVNNADQPYPINGQESGVQTQQSENPYPVPGEAQTQTSFNTPYPGPVTITPLPTLPTFQSTQPPTMANPYPYPTSVQHTITPQMTEVKTPTFSPTLIPTAIPTIEDVEFHPTDPQEVILASGKLQLIEFFAYWCGTCRSMAPLLNGLEAKYSPQMNFVFLDIDNPDTNYFKEVLVYKWQPHFFLISETGEILNQWIGYVPIQEIETAIQANLH